jgi:hypothetical protein
MEGVWDCTNIQNEHLITSLHTSLLCHPKYIFIFMAHKNCCMHSRTSCVLCDKHPCYSNTVMYYIVLHACWLSLLLACNAFAYTCVQHHVPSHSWLIWGIRNGPVIATLTTLSQSYLSGALPVLTIVGLWYGL